MQDFINPIDSAVENFGETVALKLRQLRKAVPRAKAVTNSALTGAFVEEVVRSFLKGWIRHQKILHGTFVPFQGDSKKPFQIDGIVYDPHTGPITLSEGEFVVVHPAFCSGVIEIKTSVQTPKELEERLQKIYLRHFQPMTRTTSTMIGIVIFDKDPEKSSERGVPFKGVWHDYAVAGHCPIFYLFKDDGDGNFTPYHEGIASLIRCIYTNLLVTQNYLA